jgi:hypothetical protein
LKIMISDINYFLFFLLDFLFNLIFYFFKNLKVVSK